MNNLNFLKFVKPYRLLIFGTILSLIVFTNLGMIIPWILKIIIDKVLGASDVGYLMALLSIIIIAYVIREIFFYISHYMTYYIAQRILFDIRTTLFKHIQSLSLKFYSEYRTGKLISNILTDVSMLQQMISAGLINIIVNIFMIACISVFLLILDYRLALISFIIIPLQFFNFRFFKKRIKKGAMELREMMSEISANLAETINGVKIVKSFAQERSESRVFAGSLRQTIDKSMRVNMLGVFVRMLTEVINVGCRVAILGIGGIFVMRGEMTIGSFVAFFAYLGMLVMPINQLSGFSVVLSQGLASGQRIMNLLRTVPDIQEADNAIVMKDVIGEVEFEDVSFGYDEKRILTNFNLTIEPGKKVALVGPSGSGKSTVASLMLRFYDVNQGAVKVDGLDVRKLNTKSFRSNVGIVLQEPLLFSGSIIDNIRYGRKDATYEEIVEAARQANAEEFIEELENGYESQVGENGVTLSGGQRQRLAIARTILKNPKVLVLDEATSSLDTVSEYAVQEALDNLVGNKTTIIIAHRLSTIRNADSIVVLEKGRIVQTGTHDQLMSEKGLYKNLYKLQEKEKKEDELGKKLAA